jgi:hypothetical protein
MERIELLARALFICALMAVLGGCANAPTSLGKMPARDNIAAAYGGTANYNTIDKYSFAQAELEYPASKGHHRLQIGDYLLGEVFDIFKNRAVQLVRLVSFKAQCNPSGMFMPRAICEATYSIDVQEGSRKVVSSTLAPVDIGNIHVRQDQFFFVPLITGDDFYQRQVAPFLKALSEDLRKRLAPPP